MNGPLCTRNFTYNSFAQSQTLRTHANKCWLSDWKPMQLVYETVNNPVKCICLLKCMCPHGTHQATLAKPIQEKLLQGGIYSRNAFMETSLNMPIHGRYRCHTNALITSEKINQKIRTEINIMKYLLLRYMILWGILFFQCTIQSQPIWGAIFSIVYFLKPVLINENNWLRQTTLISIPFNAGI